MAMSWVGLLTLMVEGPDLPVRGVIRTDAGSDESARYAGFSATSGQPMPAPG